MRADLPWEQPGIAPVVSQLEHCGETDNHLIELAVAGGAEFLVTRNLRDLTFGEMKFPTLRTLSPEDFLKEL